MNGESTVQKISNCLDALLCEAKPEAEYNVRICSDKQALCHELRRKVHMTLERIENYPEIKSIVIKFVHTCYGKKCCCDHLTFLQMSLVLLRLLQKALSQEEAESCSSKNHGGCKVFMPRGLLSISQQEVLRKCFQFIIGLGILPNLLRGIGVPLCRRLQHSNFFENFSSDCTMYQKHVQLVLCLETLLDCLECDAMQSILFSYHGTDLFATLLQLCHAPIKKIEESQNAPVKVPLSEKIEFRSILTAIRDNSQHSECEVVALMLMHRNHFKERLEKFCSQISPPLLIWELILFQGIPIQSDVSEMAITRCPGWMRKICNKMLTDLLMQSHGIVSLVRAVLDKAFVSDKEIETGKVDTKQMEAVAHLITMNCLRDVSLKIYMQRLSKQVFHLLHLKGSAMDSVFKFIASCIVVQFYIRDKELGENIYFNTILEPLRKCVLNHDNCVTKVIVSEKEFATCIDDLYQIFIICTLPPRRECIDLMFPLFHCLIKLYFFLVKGTSFLKSRVRDLLIAILTAYSNEKSLALLSVVTIPNCQHPDVMETTVSFANGEGGGVIAIKKKKKTDITEEISCYHALLDLISDLHNKELNSSFILLIMKEYCSYHLEVKEAPFNTCNDRVRLAFSALLQELSEWNADIGEALISNISEVMDLLMTLLESICNYRTGAPFYEETAMVILMILSSLLTSENHELEPNDWLCIKKCLPSLLKLQKCAIDTGLKEMLFSVLIHIATHGAADTEEEREFLRNYTDLEAHIAESNNVSDDDSSTESTSMELLRESFLRAGKFMSSLEEEETKDANESCESPSNDQQLIQEEINIPKYLSNLPAHAKLAGRTNSVQKDRNSTPYELFVNEARNSEIPIRGHGLNSLSNLIRDKDEETLQHKGELLELFRENLKDDDSYVYSPAIKGLSSLADVDTEMVLPLILDLYKNPEEKCDIVLKVGEVLLKICDLLGEMIFKYSEQLLDTYLIVAKHSNPQIRSSSLSNLGQACLRLEFNIRGHYLQEILVCVLSYLKTDRDVEVRRCAVMVITLLMRGIGKNMLEVLKNEIRTIHNQLKLVFNTEQDEVIHLHSQLALEEINKIMKDLLFTQQPFLKEIRMP